MSHAATPAMRSGRFPCDDALDARAIKATLTWGKKMSVLHEAQIWSSPASCAIATTQILGVTAQIAPALAEIDHGRWRGQRLTDIAATEPDALAAWTIDPEMASHGGESFSAAVTRVGMWLDALDQSKTVVAVTHASIMRAAIIHALAIAPASFSRIEITPLSVVQLRRSAKNWHWLPSYL